MSVEDESWDRPICEYCHCEIPYGQKANHKDGICMKIMKRTYQPVGEEAILESISENQDEPMPSFGPTTSLPQKGTLTIEDDDVVDLNICSAADDIIEIFEKQGFTTDSPPDIELLRHLIVEVIEKRITPSINSNTHINSEATIDDSMSFLDCCGR